MPGPPRCPPPRGGIAPPGGRPGPPVFKNSVGSLTACHSLSMRVGSNFHATNPAASLPDLHQARRALERAELVIVQDLYHPTETTRYADVLLPVANWAEKESVTTNSERMVSYSERLLAPPGAAQPDWRIIADVAHRNIVATDDVQGRVTIVLYDVPWDQALDILLKSTGLEMVEYDDVITISTSKRLEEERKARLAALNAGRDLEPLQTAYLRVNYVKPADLARLLRGADLVGQPHDPGARLAGDELGVARVVVGDGEDPRHLPRLHDPDQVADPELQDPMLHLDGGQQPAAREQRHERDGDRSARQ